MKDQPNGYKQSNQTNGDAFAVDPTIRQKTPTKQDEQIKQQQQEHQHHHFVERVVSLPLVKESVDTAQTFANKTFLGRFAMNSANTTLTTLTRYASKSQPIQRYYQDYIQPHVEKADSLGCQSLDYVKAKVPLINEPSSHIIYVVVKEPSSKIIDGIKVKLDNTIGTVTHPVYHLAKTANKKITFVVDNVEGVIDNYLPPSSAHNNSNDENNEKSEAAAQQKHEQQQQQQHYDGSNRNLLNGTLAVEQNQMRRLYDIMKQIPSRISQQVQRSKSDLVLFIQQYSPSRDDTSALLEKKNAAVAVAASEGHPYLRRLADQIKYAQDTFTNIIRFYSSNAQERLPDGMSSSFEYTNALMTGLRKSMEKFVHHVKTTTTASTYSAADAAVPNWLKKRIQATLETTAQQLKALQDEIARKDISYTEKVGFLKSGLQQQIAPLFNNLTSTILTYINQGKEKGQAYLSHSYNHYEMSQKVKTQ
ncbi:hypothetical protein BDF20DRAFT_847949 [Mycotypha africana]|uniref:uncharacterized protein n=1 Tax=Mycotypha africana TaxID=64632 RepID=UPI0023018E61|nr:uncharacterized protein BDF20DRAFT_847949 [Mycotypha africana]KAI8992049.1 hypothetical protein BDF20DRAFT_847949 [Mycotypha africana]